MSIFEKLKNVEKEYLIIGAILIFVIVFILFFNLKFFKGEENNIKENVNLEVPEEINEEKKKIIVHVDGKVENPGVYELEEGDRLNKAIMLAGGTTSDADTKNINLAYLVTDGSKVYIPSIQEEKQVEIVENYTVDKSPDKNKGNSKIDINTASKEELEKIKGVGPSTAEKIIEYRKEHSKFSNIEEIKEIKGIGDAKFEKLKEYITVGEK